MTDRIVVRGDAELADLIPGYLSSRRADVERILVALLSDGFAEIAAIAHPIKGSGGGYGFDFISEAGDRIERAARGRDPDGVWRWTGKLADYLARVIVVYGDEG